MLYNIKKSFAIHHIKQNQHTIYFEEYGNPLGIPVIFFDWGFTLLKIIYYIIYDKF